MTAVELRRLAPGDEDVMLAAPELFDAPPRREWATAFLAEANHSLIWATVDGEPAGFISGMLIRHPDKGVEVLLYELGVEEQFRRRGVARELVEELAAWGRDHGCVGMWVPVDSDNKVAQQFYRSTGAAEPDRVLTYWWSFEAN